MLSLNDVSLRRGSDVLIQDANFTIHRGARVGLIGANGSGKTSLFHLILGDLDCDTGSLDLPGGTRLAHMAQEVAGTAQPAIDYVLAGDSELARISEAIADAEAQQSFDHIAALHEQLDNIDGYSARARAEQLMAGLGFQPEDTHRPLTDFSGGWRIRLNLARTLLQPSDLLLLDEPTNHLDLDAMLYLVEWIQQYPGTLLLISHDREFLDDCVNQVLFLHGCRLELFTGNYTAFERIRAERLALQQGQYEKQQREIAHMQSFVRRFKAKATKAKQAQSRVKALERMALIAPAHVDSPFSFEVLSQEKVSVPLLTLQEASLGYQAVVLSNVNLTLLPGDRYGLLGVNGAGKSTLIRSLLGDLPLLAGNRTPGLNLNIAYFSQHQADELDLHASAVEHLARLSDALGDRQREQALRTFLGGFNFTGDKVLESVGTFSGGEKARLALALITYRKPNLLLMDEPTNHLDIDMRQALTVALQSFEGALIVVSHDRHLLANSVDQFLLVDDGNVTQFEGDLETYRRHIVAGGDKSAGERKPPPEQGPKQPAARPGRDARQIRTRLRTLESTLERLQRKLAEVERALSDPDLYANRDHPDLQRLLRDQLALRTQLDAAEEDWLALSDELETRAR